jgi:phage recombination protein Bet
MGETTQKAGQAKSQSLLVTMAGRYGVDPDKMLVTLKATAFRGEVSNEQMMALLLVANQYDLNPWTKEIYAFPDKKLGIIPVVGVDGWSRIINSNPAFDGMEFRDAETMIEHEKGEHKPCPEWIECLIYRKDRRHPTSVRERFTECYRAPFKGKEGYTVSGPWQTHTSRFLRHKAMIQAARIAFGFVGIYDPDEADRMREVVDLGPAQVVQPAGKKALSAAQALDTFAGDINTQDEEKEPATNDSDA